MGIETKKAYESHVRLAESNAGGSYQKSVYLELD